MIVRHCDVVCVPNLRNQIICFSVVVISEDVFSCDRELRYYFVIRFEDTE